MKQTYIALLRGVNLGNHNKIKMEDLKLLLKKTGLERIQTYIQSGNLVFQFKTEDNKTLEIKIKAKIAERYGFDVPVIVISSEDLKNIIRGKPITKDLNHLYILFLSEFPDPEKVKMLDPKQFHPEKFVKKEKIIYLYLPNGYGRAKLNNNFFENKLKLNATTRNWKTVLKLYEMAMEYEN